MRPEDREPEGRRSRLRLPRLSHGTAVAYVALFLALSGGSWAAVRIASSSGVKVRCSASQGRKRVKCSVVKGNGVGPRGQQGPPGPRGVTGPSTTSTAASGPTTLTQLPGWTVASGGLGAPDPLNNGQVDFWNVYNAGSSATTGSSVVVTYLLSPSEIVGGTAHLASVQFCYGTSTSRDPSSATSMTIANATATEFSENGATVGGTYTAPAYTTSNLINQNLSLTNEAGCQAVSVSNPVAITAGGYIELLLTVDWKLAKAGATNPQVTLELGRVTATYS
jgi:hypothetical protein